jgi:oligoendopeptidase F
MKLLVPLVSVSFAACSVVHAAADTSGIPDYSQTERAKVPEEFKFDLKDLFKDADAWRNEFEAVKQQFDELPGLTASWSSSAGGLAAVLELQAAVGERIDRLFGYAKLVNDMDLSDPVSAGMLGEIQAFEVEVGKATSFIAPGVIALGEQKLSEWIAAEARLKPFRFPLEKILRGKDHVLPEAEQSIVAQVGLFADTLGKASNLLNDLDIPPAEVVLADGTKVVLNQANFLKHRMSHVAADRKLVVDVYWKNLRPFENTFAALMDGEMKKQVAFAKIYKFPSCLEATLFPNNISPGVYHNLISTVRSNLDPLHRHFRLKRKMLGLKELSYSDVAVPAAPAIQKTYTYDEAKALVMGATAAPLGELYQKRLGEAFDGRWVDIYPNKGKQGGAYSMGVYGVHPFVKMNYTGRFDEVSTLAHELGHSMHSVFSNESQPFPVAQYPIFIAEIASTFNEILLVREVLRTADDDKLKLQMLEGFLERMRATIYTQTMFAEFELAMHTRAEQGQSLTAEWLNATNLRLFREYMGSDKNVVRYDETPAISWAAVPHYYRPFYVFQYATGMVAASAFADAVLTDGVPARDRYLGLLRSGGSKHPLDLLVDAGVDMSQPAPISAALRQFDSLVAEMEAIYERLPAEDRKGTSK